MFGRLKTAILGAVVVGAALVPLFGDPRQTPVTHPIWGRMLLRALEMQDALRDSPQASQVFSTLSWRDSLSLPGDRFAKGDGVAIQDQAGVRRVVAGATPGQVMYPVAVVQGGDYQFRMRMAGEPGRPATAEVLPYGGGRTYKTFTVAPAQNGEWLPAGVAHLDPGSYKTEILLPPGASLERVEIAPRCAASVEPVGGWHPTAITTVEDVAVTSLRALDLESELPPADTPIEISASEFEVDEYLGDPAREPGLAGEALRAGGKGLRGLVMVNLPEAGLYTVSAFGADGSGARWTADGCRKAVVCPSPRTGWRVVMSQPMSAGRHTIAVVLGDGAVVERVRIERKKDGASDYLATLRRLGFDPGPDGPIARAKATEAVDFLRDRNRARVAGLCGDPTLPEFQLTPTPQVAVLAAGAPAQVAIEGPGGPDVLGPSLLPPQEPASPTSPN